MKKSPIKIFLLILIVFSINGCRGWRTEKAPVHPNINFDFQPKIKAQTDPKKIPANTIQFQEYTSDNNLKNYEINEVFIKNGQKNYNIYCAACHTKTGNGTKSIISKNGWIVSNILEDVTYNKSDKELYNIIKYGIRSMPGYGNKLDTEEIWQVVLYVRSLQKIQRASNYERKVLKNK